ncbi:MAG: hypothetical protein ABFC78_02695, partial [Methanoregula sp.]
RTVCGGPREETREVEHTPASASVVAGLMHHHFFATFVLADEMIPVWVINVPYSITQIFPE